MKTTTITIRIDPELKAKLQAEADKQKRSLANLINLILLDSIQSK
jgi:predicted HicB family RNase H-like nuclease